MTTLYYDADAHLERLTGRRVAVGCKHVEGGPNPGGIAIFELG